MRQSVPLLPRRKFRLLPVVIVGVAVLLAVRLGELSFGVELSPAGPAIAAEGAGADAPKPEKSSASAAEPAGGDGEPQEEQQTSGFPVDFTPAEVAVLQDLANRRIEQAEAGRPLGRHHRERPSPSLEAYVRHRVTA